MSVNKYTQLRAVRLRLKGNLTWTLDLNNVVYVTVTEARLLHFSSSTDSHYLLLLITYK